MQIKFEDISAEEAEELNKIILSDNLKIAKTILPKKKDQFVPNQEESCQP